MSDFLYCPIRKIQVAALPEEKVRHALIQKMIDHLGYPREMMVLEKSLNQLPHIHATLQVPKRRTDLIVFGKEILPQHSLYPLLLIECKSIPLTDKVLRQIVGYNQFVGSYFIAAVSQNSSFWGYYCKKQKNFRFIEGFPGYAELMRCCQV